MQKSKYPKWFIPGNPPRKPNEPKQTHIMPETVYTISAYEEKDITKNYIINIDFDFIRTEVDYGYGDDNSASFYVRFK